METENASGEKPRDGARGDEKEAKSESSADPEEESMKERLLRLRADFDNFKKRTERERAEFVKHANEELVRDLLPVLDNFKLAVENVDDQGVKMIYAQTMDVLKKHGLEPIDSEGCAFDPYKHEAVMAEKTDRYPDSQVIEEFQKGYTMGDRVLRHARVKVAKAPEGTAACAEGGRTGEENNAKPNAEPNAEPNEDREEDNDTIEIEIKGEDMDE